MKNKIKIFFITLIFIGMIIPSIAQTSSSSSTTSSGETFRSRFGTDNDNNTNRQSIVYDFVRAIIAGKLRHPDPKVRKQAIQTIVESMVSGEGDNSDTNEGGARNLFSIGNNDNNSDDNTTSVGAVVYIPDLYALLSDPDPEVRDTASVALDALFGTDTTLMRLMDDPDLLLNCYLKFVQWMV